MVKLNRRQVLLAAVTTGVAASIATDYWRSQANRQRQAELEALAEAQRNPERLLQQAFQQDVTSIDELRQIQTLSLAPPAIPYNHQISKLLIQCNKLASQQYLKGKIDSTYDGTLSSLPAYRSNLDRYTQIAAFTGLEAEVEETVDVTVPTANSPQDLVQQQAEQTKKDI